MRPLSFGAFVGSAVMLLGALLMRDHLFIVDLHIQAVLFALWAILFAIWEGRR